MNQIDIMESHMASSIVDSIEVLYKTLDDLKCCGNCKHYTMTQKCYNMRPGAYCPKWTPDGLTRKDRE